MTCQGRVLLMWDYGETSCNKPINMGVQPEGFQRAIGKPFGRLHRGEIPCNKKDQQQGKRFSQCWSVAPIWRDNMQVVGRASWGRSCGSAKLLAGTLRCLRLCWRFPWNWSSVELLGRCPKPHKGRCPLTLQGEIFPLTPFARLSCLLLLTLSACGFSFFTLPQPLFHQFEPLFL